MANTAENTDPPAYWQDLMYKQITNNEWHCVQSQNMHDQFVMYKPSKGLCKSKIIINRKKQNKGKFFWTACNLKTLNTSSNIEVNSIDVRFAWECFSKENWRKKTKNEVREIANLSWFHTKISDRPLNNWFVISHIMHNYGPKCVNYARNYTLICVFDGTQRSTKRWYT